MTKNIRSLYQCSHAKVIGSLFPDKNPASESELDTIPIACDMRHDFPCGTFRRQIHRGKRLELTCCQSCKDFDSMGPPLSDSERGWIGVLNA